MNTQIPSPADDLTTEVFGVPAYTDTTPTLDHLDALQQVSRWQSHLSWAVYTRASAVHQRTATEPPSSDTRLLDDFAQSSARLAVTLSLSRPKADAVLNNSLAMATRLPRVGECLRDGVITDEHFRYLVTHTDLIDGEEYARDVDEAIAHGLRRDGAWSTPRLRDLADRIIFRHDPDAVRRRHALATSKRTCDSTRLRDGMAKIGITATAEEAAIAIAAVNTLAESVCKHDPRTLRARRSDAAICRLQGVAFHCQCDRDDCAATTDLHGLSDRTAQVVIHLIATSSTLFGDSGQSRPGAESPERHDGQRDNEWGHHDTWPHSTPSGKVATRADGDEHPEDEDYSLLFNDRDIEDWSNRGCEDEHADTRGAGHQNPGAAIPGDNGPDAGSLHYPGLDPDDPEAHLHIGPHDGTGLSNQPGFLDGYGVISADHVRSIAARPTTTIRPINPAPGTPLPSCLPSDSYRFSAALDTYVRARDGYCTFRGCTSPAWRCDLDHVTEFDHENPTAGGQTTSANAKAGCRFHHLLKTFSDWLDDQYTGPDGRTRIEIRTPEGFVSYGSGHTNEDLFPELLGIKFQDPPAEPITPVRRSAHQPQRQRTRTAAKHARRRHDRKLNRRAREAFEDGNRARPSADPPA